MIYKTLPEEAFLKLQMEMSDQPALSQNLYQPEHDSFYQSEFYGYVEVSFDDDLTVAVEINGKHYLPVRLIKIKTYSISQRDDEDQWRKILFIATKRQTLEQIYIQDDQVELIENGVVPYVYWTWINPINAGRRYAILIFENSPPISSYPEKGP